MIFTRISAIFIPQALLGNYQGLIWTLIPIQSLLIVALLIIGKVDTNHGPASFKYAMVLGVVFFVLAISLLFTNRFKIECLILALLLNFSAIFFIKKKIEYEYQSIKMCYVLKDSLIERY